MIDTNNLYVVQGRYKGTLWTRLPRRYLMWVANSPKHQDYYIAISELERRGSNIQKESVELTSHAIDRASLSLYRKYLKDRKEGEGLYSWLYKNTVEADKKNKLRSTEIVHNGITFVFKFGRLMPVLITVYKSNYKPKHK